MIVSSTLRYWSAQRITSSHDQFIFEWWFDNEICKDLFTVYWKIYWEQFDQTENLCRQMISKKWSERTNNKTLLYGQSGRWQQQPIDGAHVHYRQNLARRHINTQNHSCFHLTCSHINYGQPGFWDRIHHFNCVITIGCRRTTYLPILEA